MNFNQFDEFDFVADDNPDEMGDFISIIPNENDDQFNKDIPTNLPILPLRNTVLFPSTVIPITISREKSVQLINDAYENGGKIGVVAQKSQDLENPKTKDLYETGTVAHIIKKIQLHDQNNTMVIIQGVQKFKIKEFVQEEPYVRAEVELLPFKRHKADKQLQGMLNAMKDMAIEIINLSPNIPKEATIAIKNLDSPAFIVNFIASNMNIDVKEKQKLLEIQDIYKKSEMILGHLTNELEMVKIKSEIQSKVRTDIDKQQRHFFSATAIKNHT
jgi:ATP-dependent Lon protease